MRTYFREIKHFLHLIYVHIYLGRETFADIFFVIFDSTLKLRKLFISLININIHTWL